jgi:excisionase family DNA binding protein
MGRSEDEKVWQPHGVKRYGLDIYDEDAPTRPTRAESDAAGSAPPLEVALGAPVVRRLDAISREVGFALSGLAIELPPQTLEHLIEEIVARVLARIGDVRSSEDSDEWLTTPEAAAYLKVSRQRLYDLNTSRELRPFKVGRSNRYKRSQLDAFAKEGGRRR